MARLQFFPPIPGPSILQIAEWTGAAIAPSVDAGQRISDVAPIDAAGPGHLTFLDNPRYLPQLKTTRAAAAFVLPRYAGDVPEGCVALTTPQPYRAMAEAMTRLYPSAAAPGSVYSEPAHSARAHIHPTARLETGVIVDPGAVIGPGSEIGSGTVICANAVIGPGVRIGRACSIGPNVTIACALIGDRVILHPGVSIGQDGFGFAMGARGHLKVPQVGRVIVQDGVEIGANTTIDRGANRDTVIGEGTKIDNLVQIGHNVIVGRHCILVSQCGISGSTVLEDFVALGGQAGIAGHLRIGMGAQIAAASGVMNDVPPGERWGGAPAKPLREFFREVAMIKKLSASDSAPLPVS